VPEGMEECGEAHKEDGHPSVGCISVCIGVKVVFLTAFPDVVDGLKSTLSSCLPKRQLDSPCGVWRCKWSKRGVKPNDVGLAGTGLVVLRNDQKSTSQSQN
jgi:hypothetical protein